jgi:hypothetical protein
MKEKHEKSKIWFFRSSSGHEPIIAIHNNPPRSCLAIQHTLRMMPKKAHRSTVRVSTEDHSPLCKDLYPYCDSPDCYHRAVMMIHTLVLWGKTWKKCTAAGTSVVVAAFILTLAAGMGGLRPLCISRPSNSTIMMMTKENAHFHQKRRMLRRLLSILNEPKSERLPDCLDGSKVTRWQLAWFVDPFVIQYPILSSHTWCDIICRYPYYVMCVPYCINICSCWSHNKWISWIVP